MKNAREFKERTQEVRGLDQHPADDPVQVWDMEAASFDAGLAIVDMVLLSAKSSTELTCGSWRGNLELVLTTGGNHWNPQGRSQMSQVSSPDSVSIANTECF